MDLLVALCCISCCHHDMSILACQLLARLKPEACISTCDKEPATSGTIQVRPSSVMSYTRRCKHSPQSAPHVLPVKSGMLSVFHDDREADIVVRLRRAAVEARLVKARWTLRGILVRALCIITNIKCSYTVFFRASSSV